MCAIYSNITYSNVILHFHFKYALRNLGRDNDMEFITVPWGVLE